MRARTMRAVLLALGLTAVGAAPLSARADDCDDWYEDGSRAGFPEGDREAGDGTVSVRERGKGDIGALPLEKFMDMVYTRKVI